METLYRLKSNLTTIVQIDGDYTKVFWSKVMETGIYNSRWMIARLNMGNLIQLTDEEAQDIRAKYEAFKPVYAVNQYLSWSK